MTKFEMDRAAHEINKETGNALGDARYDRGQYLTDDERQAMQHESMWGSDSWPIRKLGRKWTIEHPCMPGAPLYATKTAAVNAWDVQLCMWRRLAGRAAFDLISANAGGR